MLGIVPIPRPPAIDLLRLGRVPLTSGSDLRRRPRPLGSQWMDRRRGLGDDPSRDSRPRLVADALSRRKRERS